MTLHSTETGGNCNCHSTAVIRQCGACSCYDFTSMYIFCSGKHCLLWFGQYVEGGHQFAQHLIDPPVTICQFHLIIHATEFAEQPLAVAAQTSNSEQLL